jgi:hypothetical protein
MEDTMRLKVSVDREHGLWRGYITLHKNGNQMTASTENNSQSANGAWDEVIRVLQRAIDDAEADAKRGHSITGKLTS